jgi:hypothetical protein
VPPPGFEVGQLELEVVLNLEVGLEVTTEPRLELDCRLEIFCAVQLGKKCTRYVCSRHGFLYIRG